MVKMFPSKNIVDYMSEINRLFPRPNESDLYSTHYPSPMSGANRSSSSADSTSPESFPELLFSPKRSPMPVGPGIIETPRLQDSTNEHQFIGRRQRPIVGRKIIPTAETQPPIYEKPNYNDQDYGTWPIDDTFLQNTPPRNFYVERNAQNVFYELFPSENRGFEFSQFLTPVKQNVNRNISPASPNYASPSMTNMSPNMNNISPSMTNMSPNMNNISPTMTNMSPIMTNMSPTITNMSPNMTNMSPNMTNMPPNMTNMSATAYNTSQSQYAPNSNAYSYQRPRFESNASSISSQGWAATGVSRIQNPDLREKMCTFCRKNGERPQVFMTHTVKERVGNRHVVTCPILRSHVCATCGLTGDDAHTITYCPVLRSTNHGLPLQSTTITLKNTRLKSSGRRRF